MKFYFNSNLNICAEEDYVIDALYYNGVCDSRQVAKNALNAKREAFGWRECEVSETIQELVTRFYNN